MNFIDDNLASCMSCVNELMRTPDLRKRYDFLDFCF